MGVRTRVLKTIVKRNKKSFLLLLLIIAVLIVAPVIIAEQGNLTAERENQKLVEEATILAITDKQSFTDLNNYNYEEVTYKETKTQNNKKIMQLNYTYEGSLTRHHNYASAVALMNSRLDENIETITINAKNRQNNLTTTLTISKQNLEMFKQQYNNEEIEEERYKIILEHMYNFR